LVAEVDAAGNVVKSYGYMPVVTWTSDPLFMKQGSDYYFYQNDHLGTPQKMTAVNGAVVWSAKYSSFGKADVDPSSSVTNNLRFSGQYFDQEIGLHYNYYRYYDPKSGRYLTPDPIGLVGGINLYLYVSGNPINLVDPKGLIWVTIEIDNDGIKNWINHIVRHFIYAEEGRAITHTDNSLGATRILIQEWQHDEENPCRDSEHTIGATRRIKQTFQKKPEPPFREPGYWDSTTENYWAPPVGSRTYQEVPDAVIDDDFNWYEPI
jgi:RHS repeat-associated protein